MSRRSKFASYISVFAPSAGGMVVYVSLAVITLVIYQLESIKHLLLLPQLNIAQFITGNLEQFLLNTLGDAKTNTLVVGLFWAVVGLFVYIFLRGVARFVYELGEDLEERRYVWPKGSDRYRPLERLAERALFRVAVAIALIVYVSHYLAPVLRGPVFVDFIGPSTLLQHIIWFFVLFLAWHGLVILLRLLVLKERLFG